MKALFQLLFIVLLVSSTVCCRTKNDALNYWFIGEWQLDCNTLDKMPDEVSSNKWIVDDGEFHLFMQKDKLIAKLVNKHSCEVATNKIGRIQFEGYGFVKIWVIESFDSTTPDCTLRMGESSNFMIVSLYDFKVPMKRISQ